MWRPPRHDRGLFILAVLVLWYAPRLQAFVLPSPSTRPTLPPYHAACRIHLDAGAGARTRHAGAHMTGAPRRRDGGGLATALQMLASSSTAEPLPTQSVLVVGAGAVGCVYGARLLEAGHDVSFLMRREYEAVKAKGLKITSPDGNMFFPKPSVVRTMDDYAALRSGQGPVDWVILALKTTSFPDIPALLSNPQVIGPQTRVLALMNGYGLEKDLAEKTRVDGQRIFGGMAFVCANRGPSGSAEVAHLKYGKLVMGHYRDDPSELAYIQRLWAGAKVEIETTPSLLLGRWSKCCWNMPFNGIGCILGGLSVDHIVQTPELRQLASLVMLDVIKAANAELSLAAANDTKGARQAFAQEEGRRETSRSSSIDIPRPTSNALRIEKAFHDHMFDLTDVMGPYMSSTVLDMLAKLPMETEYMFLKPYQRAQELGVDVPHLQSVVLAVEGIRKTRGL